MNPHPRRADATHEVFFETLLARPEGISKPRAVFAVY